MAATAHGPLTFAGVFEGIGGFTSGFEKHGWQPTSHVEINPHRQKVLRRNWPTVPQMGDIADVTGRDLGNPTAAICGFPCQGVSGAAPNRHGLRDPRSNKYWEFHRLLAECQRVFDESRPTWVVIENTPGLYRSGPPGDRGADMAAVCRSLVELGYGVAGRTVDSQGLGSSQRRERIYLVGHRSGDPRVAWRVLADAVDGSGLPDGPGTAGGPRAQRSPLVGSAGEGGEDGPQVFRKSRNARSTSDYSTFVPAQYYNTFTATEGGTGDTVRQRHLVLDKGRVRVLTPREWERGQGFPDDWTAGLTESQRFAALGDAMNVHAAGWLARRLAAVHAAVPLLRHVNTGRSLATV